MGDLQALLERVERASGSDRDLDCAIFYAVDPSARTRFETVKADIDPYHPDRPLTWEQWVDFKISNPVTGSIDAALSLVERVLPGTRYNLTTFTGLGALAILYLPGARDDGSQDVTASARTVPLAILAALLTALLRALSAGEPT